MEAVKGRKKKYYEKNKEKVKEQHREYIARNKEAIFLRQQRYRENNQEKIKAWHEATPRGCINKNLKLAIKRRPTENAATVADLMSIWEAQGGLCAISGMKMTWSKGKTLPTSISLDRIDIRAGYTKANLRLVCYQVNCFRNRWTDAEMLVMAKAIVTSLERKSSEPTWQPHLVHSEAA